MQKTVIAIEAEQQRADDGLALVVAEAADHTIRAAIVLDLLHSGTVARAVFQVAALGDDAVEHYANVFEPSFCFAQLGRRRRQSNSPLVSQIPPGEGFEPTAALAQRQVRERSAGEIRQEDENQPKRGGLR